MNKEDLDVANVSINELLQDVTRLEIIDRTKAKCDNCYGSGKTQIRVSNNPEEFTCPDCHGTGIAPQGRTSIFHNPNKEVVISLQDGGKTLKLFVEVRE